MLIRISLILAIVAALAVGALNFSQVRDKITTLQSQRDDYHSQRDTVQGQLNSTNKILVATQSTLKKTEQDLATTQAERDKAAATATAQTKRANDLSEKLTKTTQERDTAQADLAAYQATGMTSMQVGKLAKSLKDQQEAILALNDEKTVMQHTITRLNSQLNELLGTDTPVKLPAGLRGKILVVDPKWDFVVLNIGEDQGVLPDGQLLVSRDGKLVAKVIVRSLEKGRCIANLVPGWKLGQVIEGDEVTPAYPAS